MHHDQQLCAETCSFKQWAACTLSLGHIAHCGCRLTAERGGSGDVVPAYQQQQHMSAKCAGPSLRVNVSTTMRPLAASPARCRCGRLSKCPQPCRKRSERSELPRKRSCDALPELRVSGRGKQAVASRQPQRPLLRACKRDPWTHDRLLPYLREAGGAQRASTRAQLRWPPRAQLRQSPRACAFGRGE